MSTGRFDYVKFDEEATTEISSLKNKFIDLEAAVDQWPSSRAKSLVLTKLEEAYMWCGKEIRDRQIKRDETTEQTEERTNV